MAVSLTTRAQRERNRARWRRDLCAPERERTRSLYRFCVHVPGPETDCEPRGSWCAGGRAVQLLIDNPGMVRKDHEDLAGQPAVGWAAGGTVPPGDHGLDSGWVSSAGVPDVNLSAFTGFYDLVELVYGVDQRTMREIESASDEGRPMREIARMIPP